MTPRGRERRGAHWECASFTMSVPAADYSQDPLPDVIFIKRSIGMDQTARRDQGGYRPRQDLCVHPASAPLIP